MHADVRTRLLVFFSHSGTVISGVPRVIRVRTLTYDGRGVCGYACAPRTSGLMFTCTSTNLRSNEPQRRGGARARANVGLHIIDQCTGTVVYRIDLLVDYTCTCTAYSC